MTFHEALNLCKLGEFVNAGYAAPKSVVQIGADEGQEIPYYLSMGAKVVIAIETGPAFEKLYERFKDSEDVIVDSATLGAYEQLVVTSNTETEEESVTEAEPDSDADDGIDFDEDDEKDEPKVPVTVVSNLSVQAIRPKRKLLQVKPFWLTGYSLSSSLCYIPSALVVRVPGAELSVLAGFKDLVRRFAYAVIEVSREPVRNGAPYGQSVKDYMTTWGFRQFKFDGWDSIYGGDIPVRGDMLFIRSS